MSKAINDDSVIVPKDLYVLNALAAGVSLQLLSKLTGETIESWRSYIAAKADEQYKQLSTQEIQQIVNSLKASGN